jgi:hypothetical protein
MEPKFPTLILLAVVDIWRDVPCSNPQTINLNYSALKPLQSQSPRRILAFLARRVVSKCNWSMRSRTNGSLISTLRLTFATAARMRTFS